MIRLHYPGAHEHGDEPARRLASKQLAPLGLSDLDGGGVGLRTNRTMSTSVVCNQPLPASSWMSERKGRLCKG